MNVVVGRRCLRRVLKDEAEATRKRIQETPCRGEERRQQGPRRPGRVEGGTVRGCHVLQVAAHPCGQSDEARPAGLESQQAQRASSARQQVENFLIPRATENSGGFTHKRDANSERFQKGNRMATWRANLWALNPEQTFEVKVKSSVLGLWGCWASSSHWPRVGSQLATAHRPAFGWNAGKIHFQTKVSARQ